MQPQSFDPRTVTPNNPNQTPSSPTPASTPSPVLGDTPPQINFPSEPMQPKKGNKKLLIGLLTVLLLAIAGGLVYWFVLREKPSVPATNDTKITTIAPNSVFCTKLGLNSLHCENLETKELRKYTLPKELGEVSQFLASPDDTKYYINSWDQTDEKKPVQTAGIYNAKLELISKLPFENDANGNSPAGDYNTSWLDDNRIIYEKAVEASNKTSFYTFDAVSKKESELVTVDADIERVMPVVGKDYIYGIQAKIDEQQNAVVRNLVVIDTKAKTVKDIASDSFDAINMSYSVDNSRFYNNLPKGDKSELKVYKVEAIETKPKLIEVQTVKDSYAFGPAASEAITTNKGVLAGTSMLERNFPFKFTREDGKVTESKVGVGGNGSGILLSLDKFPYFPKAEKNEPVVSDFYIPAAETPKKIVSFLQEKAMNNPKCSKGTYTTFELLHNDGDKQFSVIEASCGHSGLVIYVAEGDSYKAVLTSQEGVSCEERDKLGITAKALPGCRKSGEGL